MNPRLGKDHFPGQNNPFFTGGNIPGNLIGPNSDIFYQQNPQMKKKPGPKIRYDPIGPFGFPGNNQGGNSGPNDNNGPFFGWKNNINK